MSARRRKALARAADEARPSRPPSTGVHGDAVRPMPPQHLRGPGRDRRFSIPQYLADVDGLRTAFFDSGGDLPAVVFLHGLAGNLTHWVDVAPALQDRCRVIGIDLPGCGESAGRKADLRVRRYAEHSARLLDVLGLERASLVGHSLGGMVATTLALTAPSRVEHVVVLNPAGFMPLPLPLRVAGRLVMRQAILDPLLVRVWKGVLGQVFRRDNEHTRAFIRSVRETYLDSDIGLITRVISELRHDYLGWDFGPMLQELRVPMTMVWGSDDRLVPARFLRRAAARMPQVTTHELPGCGHMPNIEAPFEVVAAIEDALALGRSRR